MRPTWEAVRLDPPLVSVVVVARGPCLSGPAWGRPAAGHLGTSLRRAAFAGQWDPGRTGSWRIMGARSSLQSRAPMIVNDFSDDVAAALSAAWHGRRYPNPVVFGALQKGRLKEVLSRHRHEPPAVPCTTRGAASSSAPSCATFSIMWREATPSLLRRTKGQGVKSGYRFLFSRTFASKAGNKLAPQIKENRARDRFAKPFHCPSRRKPTHMGPHHRYPRRRGLAQNIAVSMPVSRQPYPVNLLD